MAMKNEHEDDIAARLIRRRPFILVNFDQDEQPKAVVASVKGEDARALAGWLKRRGLR